MCEFLSKRSYSYKIAKFFEKIKKGIENNLIS